MSDHEFEKKVQRKLDELRLRPSDAVWAEVEKNIRPNKRRRFIFWLPVLFFFLATSGYVLYTTNQPSASIAQATPVSKTNASSSSTNTIAPNEKNSTSIKENDPLNEEKATGHSVQPADNRAATATSETIHQQEQIITATQSSKQKTASSSLPDAHETTSAMKGTADVVGNTRYIATKSGNKPKRYKNKPVHVAPERLAEFHPMEHYNTMEEQSNDLVFTMPQTVPQSAGLIATGQAAPDPFTSRSVKLSAPEKQNSPAALPVPPIQKQQGPKWQWGLQFNAGYSRISQSTLFNLNGLLGAVADKRAEDLAASAVMASNNQLGVTNNTNYLSTARPTVKEAAPIQPDLAYSVGVFVQRPLSKRLRVSIGLQYTYMSAHTTIGKLMEEETNVNYGAYGSKVVPEYYTSKDYKDSAQSRVFAPGFNVTIPGPSYAHKYTYRYHAFEIPVLINWQINKGRRLPPFVLDGGFSILHMRSIDALHYDGIKDIYYKDNSLFNKTQLNAIVGLNVGLFQRSKFPVWIGPSLRYSLTGLVKKDVSKGQFLWSAGINVRVGLNRLF